MSAGQNQKRTWVYELSTGIASALDMFDPPAIIDEAILAKAIRKTATYADLADQLFLKALADALDHPESEYRLKIARTKRGKPRNASAIERAISIGGFIRSRQATGGKKEAAISEVMEHFGISRSAVLRACKTYEGVRPLVDSVQHVIDGRPLKKSANSSNK